MNEDGTPIEEIEDDKDAGKSASERAAGTPEGEPGKQPDAAEIKSLYEDLGIKASVPTGATKGRPKSSTVRDEDDAKKPSGSAVSKRKDGKDDGDEDQSKASPASTKGSDDGDEADSKGSKDNEKDNGVQDEPGKTDKGVHDSESRSEKDSERGRKDDPEHGTTGDESAESDEEREAEGESDDEEGVKRPGKSNPKVEQRFQKLTNEVREKDNHIAELEKQLRETTQKQQQEKIAQEDPEYTIEDFRKVRDNEGNIHDLDENEAELAWRRWRDGYNQRSEQRNAEANRQDALERTQQETAEKLMRQSVEAYDTLASLMDEYPELVSDSGKFDANFAAKAMPLIHEATLYQEGTEPGNEEGNTPVIIGLSINPKIILEALKSVRDEKRSLPLNGVNDNVDVRSNVSVPHGRSSDPTVNAANDLYKQLNINKRL